MAQIGMTVEVSEPSNLQEGGPFLLQITFTNLGSGKTLVEIDEEGELEFELKSKKSGNFTVNSTTPLEKTIHYIYGDFPQPEALPPRPLIALMPGKSYVRGIDISLYYTKLPPAGHYQLITHYKNTRNGEKISSQPVVINIQKNNSK